MGEHLFFEKRHTLVSVPASINCCFSGISTKPSALASVVMAPDRPVGTGDASGLPVLSWVRLTITKVRRPLAGNIFVAAKAFSVDGISSVLPAILHIMGRTIT